MPNALCWRAVVVVVVIAGPGLLEQAGRHTIPTASAR